MSQCPSCGGDCGHSKAKGCNYADATLPACDCINDCGDDPWIAKGKSKPCANFIKREQDIAEFSRQYTRDNNLRKFYGLGPNDDLVATLCQQIESLQAKVLILAACERATEPANKDDHAIDHHSV